MLLLPISQAASGSFSLTPPQKIELSGEGAYELAFDASEDASGPSLGLTVPEGFSPSGDAVLEIGGREATCSAVIRGQSLVWDLTDAIRSCRHVIINEWEANPSGPDGMKEWIELYNPTSSTVDLSGWGLSESYSKKTLSLPQGTTLLPGCHKRFFWSAGSLINSYPVSLALLDSSGSEIDKTPAFTDDKNNDLGWARYPDGLDRDSESEWRFQSTTPDTPNGPGLFDLYSGEGLRLYFNLSAGCTVSSSASFSAQMRTDSGVISIGPEPVRILSANLSLTLTPDRYDLTRGDLMLWTALIENLGDGSAHDVKLDAGLSRGLRMESNGSNGSNDPGSSVWSCAIMHPGESVEIIIPARAEATCALYSCTASLRWGAGACQEILKSSEVGARTAIEKWPDEERHMTLGESATFSISAELPKGASDLWINDSIPSGLRYDEKSLISKGPTILRELLLKGPDGSQQICRSFGDARASQTIELFYNCTVEDIQENQNGEVLDSPGASMSWLDGRERKSDSNRAGAITIIEPDLDLIMRPDASNAAPGSQVEFTLEISHSRESQTDAFDLELQLMLPDELSYVPGSSEQLNGNSVAFDEKSLSWHCESLARGNRPLILSFSATCNASPGDGPLSEALLTWSSLPGAVQDERSGAEGIDDYRRNASAQVRAMRLSIEKRADPDPVPVGGVLEYTLTYENLGGVLAHNVTITDDLDPGVALLSSDPAPSQNISGGLVWTMPLLESDGPHTISIEVRVRDDLRDGALLLNRFSIGCDELMPEQARIFTQVLNRTRLSVNKTALQSAARRGEDVDYVISLCNRGGRSATNVTVRDVLPSGVMMISAWPAPCEDGAWHFSTLEPGQCIEMGLKVQVPRTDAMYLSQGNVSGEGFVRTRSSFSTARSPETLVNLVYVTSDQMQTSDSAELLILGEEGTSLLMRGHGSGECEESESMRFLTENSSIQLKRDIRAKHMPVRLSISGKGPDPVVSSLWSDDASARNGITETALGRSYDSSSEIWEEGLIDLDRNQSSLQIESDFIGMADLSVIQSPSRRYGRRGETRMDERYIGAFEISEMVRDLGQDLLVNRSAQGLGFASRRAQGRGLESHESGTGEYRVDESIGFLSGFMKKDLDVVHRNISLRATPATSINISNKWSGGMASRTKHSLISEEYSDISSLSMRAVAEGRSELASDAEFSGRARLEASWHGSSGEGGGEGDGFDRRQELSGDFNISLRIALRGSSRYDLPHLHLEKEGRRIGDVAAFTITIINDGDAALGPLYLQDLFPDGARFINSTLMPQDLKDNSSNWTLLHLAIGDTIRIGINLDVRDCVGEIINQAAVTGEYNGGHVAVNNLSVIGSVGLGCPLSIVTPPMDAIASSGIGCACLEEVQVEDGGSSDADGGRNSDGLRWESTGVGCLPDCFSADGAGKDGAIAAAST